MKKTPPHLPPKTKDLIMKETYRSMSTVIFLILIAFITAIAGTLTTIAWIAPFSVSDTTYTFRTPRVTIEEAVQIDSVVEKQVRQRMVRVFDRRQKVNTFYGDNAFVGQAMLLTAEGWAVLYDPSYVRGAHQYWEVVDHQGTVFLVEQSLFDDVSGLVYMKVAGDGFRADVSFPEWSTLDTRTPLHALHAGNTDVVAIDGMVQNETLRKVYPLIESPVAYQLAGDVYPGDVVVSANGTFIGFADTDTHLIPSWFVSTQLQSLFEMGTVQYMTLPVRGYQVAGSVQNGVMDTLQGFYVAESSTRISSTTLGIGDVIVGINGVPYAAESAARSMLFAPELVPVSILRNGEQVNLLVAKKKL